MKSLVVFLALLLPLAAQAAELTCKKSPALIAKCSMVKGSLGLTPDVGTTLETEDGGRILIKAPPGSNTDIAPVVMQNWLYWQSKTSNVRTRISGTYEVCPLAPESSQPSVKLGCINGGKGFKADETGR